MIEKNKKIAKIIKEAENNKFSNDIISFLIKPVQRLGKYELFFKDIYKNTEETHPDY